MRKVGWLHLSELCVSQGKWNTLSLPFVELYLIFLSWSCLIRSTKIIYTIYFIKTGRDEGDRLPQMRWTSRMNRTSKIHMIQYFVDPSFSLLCLWHLEMRCKNNIRRCVPTCLPSIQLSLLILERCSHFSLLLLPATSGSYGLFHRNSRRGFWLLGVTQVQRQSNYSNLFHKMPHWDVGCRNMLRNFLPSK